MNNIEMALSIQNLSYTYRGHWLIKKYHALKNISLEVQKGEVFGFLGPNGAGKTTTIKCILGLVRPKLGDIQVFGKDPRHPQTRKAIGYLPEQPYFYDHLTVEETMYFFAGLLGYYGVTAKERIERALSRVKLQNRNKSKMRSLSKGLMQRVAMAQAILGDPGLLILDEPFSGLDPIGRREFRELIQDLKLSGTTVFMSSHILNDVEFLSDRVAIMSRGELKGIFKIQDMNKVLPGAFEVSIKTSKEIPKKIEELAHTCISDGTLSRFLFKERISAEEALTVALAHKLPLERYEFVHGTLEELFVKLVQ